MQMGLRVMPFSEIRQKKARFWKEDYKFSFGHIQIEVFFFL